MKTDLPFSPVRVLLLIGIGTCLSLFGDASLYAVLPTHTGEAGVSLASVGILLSANRFIRLILNGPGGLIYDRYRRRYLFVAALLLGAFSTALYGLTQGFWPLFVGRLLWGTAWVGIWIGGNTIVLDISLDSTRGKWIGLYNIAFFLGASGGALLGGLLTDRFDYHQAMLACAGIQLLGAFCALLFLPETRGLRGRAEEPQPPTHPTAYSKAAQSDTLDPAKPDVRNEFAAALGLYSVHRIAMAGVFQPTFGLFLLGLLGAQVKVAGRLVGVATLTGLGLGLSTLISAMSAPLIGGVSDRATNRWRVAVGGLIPGVMGFCLLAVGLPLSIFVGVPLVAITGGSNQALATALMGGLGDVRRQSRRLGVMFTAGDLASAVGPPLAYALLPIIGIGSVYLLIAGLFVLLIFAVLKIEKTRRNFVFGDAKS